MQDKRSADKQLSAENPAAVADEKRKSPRIKVSVPATCTSIDAAGNPVYFNTGHIIDIGLEGIVVELFCSFTSELILVSFVGVDSKEIKIKGRVVNAERDPHGKMRIGLSFEGSEQESRQFIAHIIRCNYLNKAAYQSLKN